MHLAPADIRRGRPTVHKAFGEPLALLRGDLVAFRVQPAAVLAARKTARNRLQPQPFRAPTALSPPVARAQPADQASQRRTQGEISSELRIISGVRAP